MYIFAPGLYNYTKSYMEPKNRRLSQIIEIIERERVTSQDQLLERLSALGYAITQATLSRDLKQLKVAKMPDVKGHYRYVMPQSAAAQIQEHVQARHALEGFLSMEFSGNMGVIRTVPAYSHAIASAIDAEDLAPVAGTLAGNDTILVVLRDGYEPDDLKIALSGAYPGLKDELHNP